MYVFYATVILIGVICVVVSVFLYILDKKRTENELADVDKKLNEITEAINDAEQIVIEMNNFSDYLLEKIDSKVNDLEKRLECCDSNSTTNKDNIKLSVKDSQEQVNSSGVNEKNTSKIDIRLGKDSFELENVCNEKKEECLSLNDKHKKVNSLKDKGLDDIDIAKELDLGIREVRLILGMKN